MRPAANVQSAATAVPRRAWVPDASPPSGPATGRPERADSPTTANAMSRTTVTAAAAATTATAASVAQSMCTDGAPLGSGDEVEVRVRSLRDVVDVVRRDGGATGRGIDPRRHRDAAHRDDDHPQAAGLGHPRGRRA